MNEIEYILNLADRVETKELTDIDISAGIMSELSAMQPINSKRVLTYLLSGCAVAAVILILLGINVIGEISTDYYLTIEQSLFSLS